MSDKTPIPVTIIPLESIVEIHVSGEFIARLNALATSFFPFNSDAHRLEVIEHLKNNTNQDDPYVFHYKTVMAFLSFVESEAKAQGKTKEIMVNPDTFEEIKIKEN